MKILALLIISTIMTSNINAQDQSDKAIINKIYTEALNKGKGYEQLRHLTKEIGPRLAGSPGAAEAVKYTSKLMKDLLFDEVFLQNVKVPHWVRGEKEVAYIITKDKKIVVPICALGGSIATEENGITAPIIEVKGLKALDQLTEKEIKGKIVFFSEPMNPEHLNTFKAYSGVVGQRVYGASRAAKLGAVGTIVRSMCLRQDDQPHTGAMHYEDGIKKIPTAAISTNGAKLLSELLQKDNSLKFYFKMNCETLPDEPSHNVVGEIAGTNKTKAYIIAGGHLDAWDNGEGAHDDGAGCIQAIEALRILKAIGYKPKNTLRAVMFMNEENGLRGGKEYARLAKEKKEKHIAAIESDRGAFTPRGFSFDIPEAKSEAVKKKMELFKSLLAAYSLNEFLEGGSGADIGPLKEQGPVLIGYIPDSQRYFDFHHTAIDTFEAINKRELELGAAAIAALIYLIDKYDL